jgi:hypothetical protein
MRTQIYENSLHSLYVYSGFLTLLFLLSAIPALVYYKVQYTIRLLFISHFFLLYFFHTYKSYEVKITVEPVQAIVRSPVSGKTGFISVKNCAKYDLDPDPESDR